MSRRHRGLTPWTRTREPLMSYTAAVEAFGSTGVLGRGHAEVPLANVVGTAGRAVDFDDEFRLVNRGLRSRWQQVRQAVESGWSLPPVELIRLGELYFVVDGHHRVSTAKAMGQQVVPAHVLTICTVAYAMHCLRSEHLASKAAERGFLERIPLDDSLRSDLWLDRPQDWPRVADAAEAWAFAQALDGRPLSSRCDAAHAWWEQEVVPLVNRLRDAGTTVGLRDIELYAGALAARDRLGRSHWPDDVTALVVA